jgi:hypothetical protein
MDCKSACGLLDLLLADLPVVVAGLGELMSHGLVKPANRRIVALNRPS